MVTRSMILAGLIAVSMAASTHPADGATVTLQQGLAGYTGCRSRTVFPGTGKVVRDVPKGVLPLRGSQHHFFLRFDIPRQYSRKTLARARLMVFLPEARKPNSFTEIFCHEVITGGRDTTIDEVTDYGRGLRIGAVDSVELFSPVDGDSWRRQSFLPPAVPKGGRWISFNVTPVVERWLAGASNNGLLVMPTDRPDHLHPSTWEIDIPAPDSAGDAALRPKLVLEFAPLERPYLVGMTSSLRGIRDRSTRYGYRGKYGSEYQMSMARNEFESFQVVLYPMLADLANVRFTWTDLVAAGGAKIPAADVEYFVEDWYKLRRNWMTSGVFYGGKVYEVTDPLLPPRPVNVRRHEHTPLLFRVRTRPDTQAGTYTGTITVHADKAKPTKLKLAVKVWPYTIPEKWNFHTMGAFISRNCARFHGKDWNAELRRKYYDFLLDHRFSPTRQYSRSLSPEADLEYCLKRGMNTVYLSGNYSGGSGEMPRLKRDYETVKKLGALDYTLVYVGDETSQWNEMQRRANIIHAHLPGVQVMIGGSFPRKELTGYIDVYDPQIGGRSKTFSLQQDNVKVIAESQQRGEEFYWYVAAGPSWPYPNVQPEYPVIASRVLFWMTWKYRVTGFEYYCYNIWQRNYAEDPARRFPNVRWKADGWQKGWPSNGDGMLFYPGPISSLRFEAIRDGIEDWESHLVLRDHVEALRKGTEGGRHAALIARAEKLLKVDPQIVADFKTFTTDPETLLAERERLGELVAELAKVVPASDKANPEAWTYERAARERIAARTALRRAMLRRRHVRACQALKVKPISEQAWQGLWPR